MTRQTVGAQTDHTQELLAGFAHGLRYEEIPAVTIHAAKARVIDTLGALIGGYAGEPCAIARNIAAQMPDPVGATIIGSRIKTTPEMAAFANATAARYAEANDVYDKSGSRNGHPSDVIGPLLAVAEHSRASGQGLIAAIAVAYEIYLHMCDAFHNLGFDHTTFGGIATAAGAGRLLGLNRGQLSHCISMAAVPNSILRQVRAESSMWKVVAAGQSGRAGVFAALLARAGMQGPHMPFEGKAGWCSHIAREPVKFGNFGNSNTPFKLDETLIKQRPSSVHTISAILAAEKIAPINQKDSVNDIVVETYKCAKDSVGTGAKRWEPDSREAADHSIPYVVAATLLNGTLTPRSFDDSMLRDPELHSLMGKIQVVENAEFTKAHERTPVQYLTRITVTRNDGIECIGDSNNANSAGSAEHEHDLDIVKKFISLSGELLGAGRAKAISDFLWNLDQMEDVAKIPPAFYLD